MRSSIFRKRKKIICCLLVLIILVGCDTVKNGKERSSVDREQKVEIPEEDVDTKKQVNQKIRSPKPLQDNNSQISIKTKISKNHMLKVEIQNTCQEKVSFGAKYQLYWKSSDEWKQLDTLPGVGFKDLEYYLEENETYSDKVDLERIFGILDTGKYNIEKEINLPQSRLLVSSEFEIK